ncbi:flagellar biosynthesis regulator FlaF [Albidovulum sp.]
MNTQILAQSAYSGAPLATRTDRGIEYEVFARITGRLRAAPRLGFAALAEALHLNRQLWAVLAADVADDGNALPAELRARIFHLAEFTRLHSSRVLAGTGSPEILVEINTAIMRGLSDRGEER